MSVPIVQMQNISKSFSGIPALENVDFELGVGEIHALIGENGAGKTTLMKILDGLYSADTGSVYIKGKEAVIRSVKDAQGYGIAMIHQEMTLIPSLDVSENIWLGREDEFSHGGVIDKRKRMELTRSILKEYEIDIDPTKKIEDLSIANMQLVEIVRAISTNAEVIIMDEPTSALTDSEVDFLFSATRKLAAKGVASIFISHKLEEIYRICDKITVFRDGKKIITASVNDIPKEDLITYIAGRKLKNLYPKREVRLGKTLLEVKGLSREGAFRNISFDIKEGEILGFCGLMGAGRTEIAKAVFGLDVYDSGEIYIDGELLKKGSASIAMKKGVGMVNEDRLRVGALFALSIKDNTSLAYLRKILHLKMIVNKKQEMKDFRNISEMTKLKYASCNQLIETLSGGNQQKVIIARWLLNNPKVLILDEPTRGIDVGSKSEIHQLINELVKQGMAIIMISSEMPELLGMSDRIMVVKDGEIVFETKKETTTQDELLKYAYGTN